MSRRESGGGARPMSHRRTVFAVFVLMLVSLAFARAYLASSTGIVNVGDAADYQAIAETMSLEGRAPFVYRPVVPLLVGALFPGRLMLGFAIVCAVAMFVALYAAGSLTRDPIAGYLVATVLFLNYQVLFSAAYPARLDIVVLAVQLLFVWMALEDEQWAFLLLLPLCALLKETLLLALVPLALIAFPRRRDLFVKVGASATAFIALHLVVRWFARPSASMPPYDEGFPTPAAMLEMAAGNLSVFTVLSLLVAWGGLCFVAVHLALGGDKDKRDPLLVGAVMFLILFPLPLATDLHRAWFELLAPVVLFGLFLRARAPVRPSLVAPLTLALIAGMIPYATRLLAVDHLYLLILQERLSTAAWGGVVASVLIATAALYSWINTRPTDTGSYRR